MTLSWRWYDWFRQRLRFGDDFAWEDSVWFEVED
jgi:hypothetical protein